jgi:hypothetical protein
MDLGLQGHPIAPAGRADMSDNPAQRVGWVLWPSFLAACAAELLFFSLFDPSQLVLLGRPFEADRRLLYTLGFFGFWAIGAVSSALTLFLARSAREVNRHDQATDGRLQGGPEQERPAAPAPVERG